MRAAQLKLCHPKAEPRARLLMESCLPARHTRDERPRRVRRHDLPRARRGASPCLDSGVLCVPAVCRAQGAETRLEARTRREATTASPVPPRPLRARTGTPRLQKPREEAYWKQRRDAGTLMGQAAAVAVQRAWRRWRDDWERRLDGSAPVLEPQASAVDDALASGSGCERVLRAVVVLQRAWRWYANEMIEYGVWDEEDNGLTEQLHVVPVTNSPPFRFLVRVRLHAPMRELCLMGLGVSAHYRDARRWRVNSGGATG